MAVANKFITYPITLNGGGANTSYTFPLSQFFEDIKNISLVTSNTTDIHDCTIETMSVDGTEYMRGLPLEMTLHSPHANHGQRGFPCEIAIPTKNSNISFMLSNGSNNVFRGKITIEYGTAK